MADCAVYLSAPRARFGVFNDGRGGYDIHELLPGYRDWRGARYASRASLVPAELEADELDRRGE